jgi:rod shape-determining protein MreB
MHDKLHPGIVTVRPLFNGAIGDYQAMQELIRGLIVKTNKRFSFGIRHLVISIPSGITPVEKRAVRDFAQDVGASKIYLVTNPIAAAIGIGLEVREPVGNMVVDIGGGTTEIAVISLSGIASGECLKVAGADITELIVRHLREEYNMAVGELTAENIKIKLASAGKEDTEIGREVRGINIESGLPEVRMIGSSSIREVIAVPINQIISSIKKSLEALVIKPELSVDILDRGLFLVGGGANIRGIDKKIQEETNVPVHICDDPQAVVAKGVGEILENLKKYRGLYTT